MKKIIAWIGIGIILALFLVRLTAQQITINKYTAELEALNDKELDSQERIAELETMNAMYMTDEYIEREARKRGYIFEGEKIFREAE